MGTTPIYGFPYPDPSDLVANYPALGQSLAEDVETVIAGLGSGLNLIEPTTIANSGGTATKTGGTVNFSGVTSVSLNGVFTSTYSNYRIMVNMQTAGANVATLRLRAAGSDAATGYVTQRFFAYATNTGASTVSTTAFWLGTFDVGSEYGSMSIDLLGPNLAQQTVGNNFCTGVNSTTVTFMELTASRLRNSTQYDGFSLIVSASNMTGTVRCYGYEN